MIKITYPGTGNYSTFTYDGLGNNAQIYEQVSGSLTSTTQFVWCGNDRCESRDGSGNLVRQLFANGQANFSGMTATDYFYALNHLGSICQMANSSANLVSDRNYDPYGHASLNSETVTPDFGYAGYYLHARSGLNCVRPIIPVIADSA